MPEAAFKKGWTRVAFGEVVKLSRERTSDPKGNRFERYVGLEHIDPGDLKIRHWGDITDGTTFTSVFRPGQVLFGKRRAYQRKVAVADFSGVCSGDIYVLEPKNSILLPELLPFICQTDGFFEHAVGTSAGSLSPRTNWDSLATYEFALPPLEEQRRIGRVLVTANAIPEALMSALASLDSVVQSMLQDLFKRAVGTMPLARWCRNLITYGIVQAGPNIPNGIPYIRVSDITAGPCLTVDGMLRTSEEIAAKYKRSEVSAGDIVVALRGPVGLPRLVPPELHGANLTQGTARVSVHEKHSRDYVYWALQAPETQRQYHQYAKGSTFSEISLDALRKVEIPVMDKSGQDKVASRLNNLADARASLSARLESARHVFSTCLGSLLRGKA